jgi:hypothetical protein
MLMLAYRSVISGFFSPSTDAAEILFVCNIRTVIQMLTIDTDKT